MTATITSLGLLPSSPLAKTTTRQLPVAHRFDELIEEIQSVAAALADNAWDEGTPLPADLTRIWFAQLEAIKSKLHECRAAHPNAS